MKRNRFLTSMLGLSVLAGLNRYTKIYNYTVKEGC